MELTHLEITYTRGAVRCTERVGLEYLHAWLTGHADAVLLHVCPVIG